MWHNKNLDESACRYDVYDWPKLNPQPVHLFSRLVWNITILVGDFICFSLTCLQGGISFRLRWRGLITLVEQKTSPFSSRWFSPPNIKSPNCKYVAVIARQIWIMSPNYESGWTLTPHKVNIGKCISFLIGLFWVSTCQISRGYIRKCFNQLQIP